MGLFNVFFLSVIVSVSSFAATSNASSQSCPALVHNLPRVNVGEKGLRLAQNQYWELPGTVTEVQTGVLAFRADPADWSEGPLALRGRMEPCQFHYNLRQGQLALRAGDRITITNHAPLIGGRPGFSLTIRKGPKVVLAVGKVQGVTAVSVKVPLEMAEGMLTSAIELAQTKKEQLLHGFRLGSIYDVPVVAKLQLLKGEKEKRLNIGSSLAELEAEELNYRVSVYQSELREPAHNAIIARALPYVMTYEVVAGN